MFYCLLVRYVWLIDPDQIGSPTPSSPISCYPWLKLNGTLAASIKISPTLLFLKAKRKLSRLELHLHPDLEQQDDGILPISASLMPKPFLQKYRSAARPTIHGWIVLDIWRDPTINLVESGRPPKKRS
jgi:hypothetical protein